MLYTLSRDVSVWHNMNEEDYFFLINSHADIIAREYEFLSILREYFG